MAVASRSRSADEVTGRPRISCVALTGGPLRMERAPVVTLLLDAVIRDGDEVGLRPYLDELDRHRALVASGPRNVLRGVRPGDDVASAEQELRRFLAAEELGAVVCHRIAHLGIGNRGCREHVAPANRL